MASPRKVRARSTKSSAIRTAASRRNHTQPLFELSPLEQRVLLTVAAPQLSASLPWPAFPPHAASVHPMSQVKLSWTQPSGSDTPSMFNILKSSDGGANYTCLTPRNLWMKAA